MKFPLPPLVGHAPDVLIFNTFFPEWAASWDARAASSKRFLDSLLSLSPKERDRLPDGMVWYVQEGIEMATGRYGVPQFTVDLTSAWMVVERFAKDAGLRGWRGDGTKADPMAYGGETWARFIRGLPLHPHHETAKDLAAAVCRAALAAVETPA